MKNKKKFEKKKERGILLRVPSWVRYTILRFPFCCLLFFSYIFLIFPFIQKNHPYAREIRISVRIRPRLCFCWLKYNKTRPSPHDQ